MLPVTCFLKLGKVGRIIFLFFEIILDLPEALFFNKNRTGISTFSVCHVVSWFVAASFSLASSLISADVLSAARKRYKNTFSKVSFNRSYNQNRLETENVFLREESVVKNQKRQLKNSGSVT